MCDTISIPPFFANRQYCDLIIRYGPTGGRIELPAHKIIVCPQSKILENACNETWNPRYSDILFQQGTKTVFCLHPRHNPKAIEAVFETFYHLQHDTNEWLKNQPWSDVVHMHEIARLFGAPTLVHATKVAVVQMMKKMTEENDPDLGFATAIIAGYPSLKEGLQEIELDEAMHLLGGMTIE